MDTSPSDLDIEQLRKTRAQVLLPTDPEYEEVRKVWNRMIDRHPSLIVRCRGTADIVHIVNFACEKSLSVSVCGGGHNISGSAICEGGILIDLSLMTAAYVNVSSKTVRIQGGATGHDLDSETQLFGLATPTGIISSTGVGGLTLGGGFGWLSRSFGLAIDNLLSVEVITSNGSILKASESENEDLFWGIRGGGGNFGIVSSFKFHLYEVGPTVLFGPIVYLFEDAKVVLQNYRQFVRNTRRDYAVFLDISSAPPAPFIPSQYHGKKIISVIAFYHGPLEDGEAFLQPLRNYGNPIADAVSRRSYTEVQSFSDSLYCSGKRNYWKSSNVKEFTDELIEVLLSCCSFPSLASDILIHHVGGAIDDVTANETPYPHRGTQFVVTLGARWDSPEDEECIRWARSSHQAFMKHCQEGSYVNFITEASGGDPALAYGKNYQRLVAVKDKYDPSSMFRMNHNIKPSKEKQSISENSIRNKMVL